MALLGSPASTSFHPRTQLGFSYHSVLAFVRAWVHLTKFLCLMVTAFLVGRGTRCSDGNPRLIIPPIPVPHSPLALLFDTPSMVLTEYAQPVPSFFTLDCILDDHGNLPSTRSKRKLPVSPRSLSHAPRSHVSSGQCRILANLWRRPQPSFASTHNSSIFASVTNQPIRFSHV